MPGPGSSVWRPRGSGTLSPGWSCGCDPSARCAARRRDSVEEHGRCGCSRGGQHWRGRWRQRTAERKGDTRKMGPSYEEGNVQGLSLWSMTVLQPCPFQASLGLCWMCLAEPKNEEFLRSASERVSRALRVSRRKRDVREACHIPNAGPSKQLSCPQSETYVAPVLPSRFLR